MDIYNITGIQGSTLLLNLTLTNSDGSYVNLSGYGVRGAAKVYYNSTGYLLNLNPTIISQVSGVISISGNSYDMANVPVGMYPYDIEIFNSGDYVFKGLRGLLYINPEAYNV